MIFYFIISVATVIYFILFFSLKKYQSYHSIEIKKIITLSYNPLFDFFVIISHHIGGTEVVVEVGGRRTIGSTSVSEVTVLKTWFRITGSKS